MTTWAMETRKRQLTSEHTLLSLLYLLLRFLSDQVLLTLDTCAHDVVRSPLSPITSSETSDHIIRG